MRIRVVRSRHENNWYHDCIGEVYDVFLYGGNTTPFLSHFLWFFPEDIEVVKVNEGYTGSFIYGLA